mgnify:CR=1 FL=1
MKKFSKRVLNMHYSPIRKLVPYIDEAKKSGVKVYQLHIGQPDVETPDTFFEGLNNYKEKIVKYTNSAGIIELRESFSKSYAKVGIDILPEDILITQGGSEAIQITLQTICNPGDEVLVPEPFYTNYNGFASAVNVTVDGITTKAEEGFHLPKKEDLVKKIKPNTKSIILSNPGNPTGVVYTKDELKMLVDICIEHNLFILADEVYREFVYDGLEYISLGNFKEAEDRVIIIDSVSKRYSACGARIGSIASKNKDLIQEILKLCQGRLCVPTIEQIGAIELYKTPTDYFKEVNEEYTKRRDIVYGALQKMGGVICKEPKGAFYVSVKFPVDNAEKFIIWCLEEFDYNGETLMMAPLEGFYSTPGIGEDEARIAYILNTEELQKAMTVLDKALQAYPGRK